MESRLVPVNAFMSLCTHYDLWPSPLAEVGYAIEGLEVPTTTPANETVVVDVVAFRQRVNAVLAAEAKSGRNVAEHQARRYDDLEPDGVIVAASITVREPGERFADSVFVCLSQNEARILIGLEKAQVILPVLSVSETEVGHKGGAFADADVENAFSEPIPVPCPPPRYITIDDQSPDKEFERVVLATLVAELSHQRPRVTISTLTERAIPYLALFGAAAQARLRRRVDAAAQRLTSRDPESFGYRSPTGRHAEAAVEFLRQPELVDRRGRTQSYQAIARGSTRRPKQRREIPGQRDIEDVLAELDRAAEPPDADDNGDDDH